jgi:hypothetical protein
MAAPDAPSVRIFVAILVVEALTIAALFWFGRQFA